MRWGQHCQLAGLTLFPVVVSDMWASVCWVGWRESFCFSDTKKQIFHAFLFALLHFVLGPWRTESVEKGKRTLSIAKMLLLMRSNCWTNSSIMSLAGLWSEISESLLAQTIVAGFPVCCRQTYCYLLKQKLLVVPHRCQNYRFAELCNSFKVKLTASGRRVTCTQISGSTGLRVITATKTKPTYWALIRHQASDSRLLPSFSC